MHVFLIVIIPLVYLVSEYLLRSKTNVREQMACVFTGFVVASIYALIDFFAVGSAHIWVLSISSVWGHYLLTEVVIPFAVCTIIVMLAKDPLRVKVQYLFPVLAAFYAVFVPYKIISSGSAPDLFVMVVYPFLAAVMLFNIDTATLVFEEGINISNFLPVRCVVAFVAVVSGLLLPSVFAAYYFLNMVSVFTWIFIGLFVVSAAGLRASVMLFMLEKNAAE